MMILLLRLPGVTRSVGPFEEPKVMICVIRRGMEQ